jgi:hypothetical protein
MAGISEAGAGGGTFAGWGSTSAEVAVSIGASRGASPVASMSDSMALAARRRGSWARQDRSLSPAGPSSKGAGLQTWRRKQGGVSKAGHIVYYESLAAVNL